MTRWTTSAPVSTRPELSGPEALAALAGRLVHRFGDVELLDRALAHRSWVSEVPGTTSNERLEFLGDSVLGLVVTDHIYRTYPDLPEGALTKLRASVVNETVLADVAAEIDLGPALRLGKGESSSGGREKPSILSDATEALIGAVYLDGGWDAAAELVLALIGDRIADAAIGSGGQDFKSRLQELAARLHETVPEYLVVDEGPDHAKHFFAAVQVGQHRFDGGRGRSKKQAEQAVARLAWDALRRGGANEEDT